MDRSLEHVKRFCQCFTDHRDPKRVEHRLLDLMGQRIYGLALGYEDRNDHERLKSGPLLAPLCGKSTLNRLKFTPGDADASHRHQKIVGEKATIEPFFIHEHVRSLSKRTKRIVLDPDVTDDPLHGSQGDLKTRRNGTLN